MRVGRGRIPDGAATALHHSGGAGTASPANTSPSSSRYRYYQRDVSGEARPGELLGVLGASGAGKTTLLDALALRGAGARVVEGERLLAGSPATPLAVRALSAYVRQRDLFVGALTVREHLVFHAMLRMDEEIPYEQRMRRVTEVISEFSLSACQDVIIGIPGRIKGISGGERKRLAFASEVLTDPPLMFCDEPTSGLDSFMALTVLSTLKQMAAKGKTVVATVHQPSSEMYALFDRLLLLAEGRVAFQGTPAEALAFFASLGAPCPDGFNPADFFMQLVAVVPEEEEQSRQQVEMLCDAFHNSPAGRALAGEGATATGDVSGMVACAEESTPAAGDQCEPFVVQPSQAPSPYKASWCTQLRVVLWRSWLSVIKEPVLIKMRMLQTVMLSLMIGTVFFGQKTDQAGVMNMNGAIILFMTNMTFQNVFAVITVFSDELAVFLREHLNGMYRVDVYFLSKTLAELPVFAAIPCLFTTVFYYMVGLNPEPSRFVIAMVIAALVTGVTTSFGYLLSCLSPSTAVAMSMGAPAIFPFLLYGGFFINVGSVPRALDWFTWLSWFRFGNEAMFINQWAGVQHIDCSGAVNDTCPSSGHIVLEMFDFNEGDFMCDMIGLVCLLVSFRLLAVLILTLRAKRGCS
ncbi:protein white-like [Schistocerca americana]|uniref:protein white-like n=1 Tax=Schistocerca americana TaxID=7009 RepID=UPI001F4F5F37|nr:protein white-like [Schistocerca americana]